MISVTNAALRLAVHRSDFSPLPRSCVFLSGLSPEQVFSGSLHQRCQISVQGNGATSVSLILILMQDQTKAIPN